MKPSPLQAKVTAFVEQLGSSTPAATADELLDDLASATPDEIIEEGSYLLGSSHLWADTQGTKATEHMVRRITAADQVVRARMEREIAALTAERDALKAWQDGVVGVFNREILGNTR